MKRHQRFRKTLSIILCAVLIFTSSPEVFAEGFKALSEIDIELKPKASETKSDAKVQRVIELIDDIGTVEYTDESLGKIVAAEKAYNALNAAQKEKVTNYGTLKAARNAYDVMAAAALDTSDFEVTDSGTINSTVKWSVYTNGILEISGTGVIPTYSSGTAPWYGYASSITRILVRNTITSISKGAFYGLTSITDVTLPFAGASRDATGPESAFGYIFGYSTQDAYSWSSSCSGSNHRYGYDYAVYDQDANEKAGRYYSSTTYNTSNCSVHNGADYYRSNYRAYRKQTTNSTEFVSLRVGGGSNWYSCYNYNSGWLQTYYYDIPSTVATVTITDANKVADGAFNATSIKEINLNEGITSIGNHAFQQSRALVDFSIPETVSTIGRYAFYEDVKLEDIYIPDTVTSVSGYAFYGCTSLKTLIISRNATSIGEYAFYGCSALPKITIPNKVVQILSYAFGNCTSATTLYIPNSVKTIATYAFSGCTAITAIDIPDSVTALGVYAFSGCQKATILKIGSGIRTIPTYAFQNCSSLTELIVPDTVNAIDRAAFAGCSKLVEVIVPFVGASRDATGPESAFGYIFGYSTQDAYSWSSSCSGTTHRYGYDYAVYDQDANEKASRYYSSPSYSTSNCSVHNDADYYRSNYRTYRKQTTNSTEFVSLRVGGGSNWYSCYNYNSGWLQTYYYDIPSTVATVTITDASKVADGAFNATSIKEINLNEGITSIGKHSFQQNRALVDFSIPETVSTIGSYAFYENIALKEICIPDKVTNISGYAFYGCTSLKTLIISRNATSIGTYAFYGCSTLPKITIPNRVEKILSYAFGNCTSATTLYIPNSVKTIATYAFSGCTAVTSIDIPDSVTSLGVYAFSGCQNATILKIGSGIQTIPSYAFQNCATLTELIVPDTVNAIDKAAFGGCSKLVEVTVPFVGASRTATGPESAFGYIFGYSTKDAYSWSKSCSGSTHKYGYDYAVYKWYTDKVVEVAGRYYSNSTSNYTSCSYHNDADYYRSNYITYRTQAANSTEFVSLSVGNGSNWYSCYNYNSGWLQTYYYDIPSTVATVTITDANKVADGAFNATSIKEINLNEGITSIGNYAFQNSKSLVTFEIPKTTENVGEHAFRNVPWFDTLTDEFVIKGDGVLVKYNGAKSGITIPETVKYVGGAVFESDTTISEMILHDSLEGIGRNAFNGCSNLTSLVIPMSVTSIGTNAIPSTCTIHVYRPSAGYDYRTTNRVILNDSYTTGNDTFYYVVKDDGNIEIIGCETTSTEITVPTDINGIVVDALGNYSFENCTTINSITIPNNILVIGDYAFINCTGLINATIPKTVNSVGKFAFKDCTGLVNVTISEGVKSIGEGAFYNCTSLVEAIVPDTAEYLGEYAFYNCNSLTTATLGTGTKDLGKYTFYGCEKLTNAVVGMNVKSIGEYAFCGDTSLETVTIGLSVETIGNYAFYNCNLGRVTVPATTTYIGKYSFYSNDSLTRVILRNGIIEIDEYAFSECVAMTNINLPSSLAKIQKGAFQNCSNLATLSLPDNLTTLGAYAYSGCSTIPSVTIPAKITVISDGVFNMCVALATVTFESNATSIGYEAFRGCAFTGITLPETIETIKGNAFRECANLVNLTLPDTTKSIGESAFFDCTALNMVSMPDSVSNVSKSAFKNNDELTVTIRYCTGTIADSILEKQSVYHVVIDERISAIGKRAFASCYDLETVTYGDTVVNNGEFLLSPNVAIIGAEAFMDATLLKNLMVPDTVQSIGENAFYNVIVTPYNCKDVTVTFYYVGGSVAAEILKSQKIAHIVVNDNIHTLGDKAFNTCDILATISLPDTIVNCGADVFAASNGNVTAYLRGVDGTVDASVYDGKLKGLTYLVFDENINTIGEYAFANTNTVKGVIVNDTDLIDNYAFANSTSLKGVVIIKVGTIDEFAFTNCTALDYVEIGTAELIGKKAFADSSLTRMELDNIGTIDDYAFTNCVELKNVYIDSVININDYAFFNCIAINNVKIEEDLVHIGEHAFEECKLIPSLVLPETTKEIGAYAFYNCNSLANINIPVGVQSINDYTFFGCASLKEMLLPSTVINIGDYAFYGCVLIKNLELGDSVKTIGEAAFFNCNQAPMITLPETVESIGTYAFRGCSAITEIYIPNSVTSLGNCAFYGCTGLEQIEFGTGITSIGDQVFYGCVKLDKVVLDGEVNYIHDLAFYGAEFATVYAFENDYVENYCNDMGMVYYNMNLDFTMVLTAPTKTEYNEFEELDLTGLALDLAYTNGLERTIKTGYSVSGYDPTKLGVQTITVTYNGQSATYDVNVKAKIVSFVQITAGAPTEIIVGEELDSSNMEIAVTFTDSTSIKLTEGYTVTGYNAETIGEQTITVSYREGSCEMTVIVKDYVRGDTNGDGLVTMKDVTRLVNYLNDNSIAVIDKALDVNGDGFVTIKDVTRLTEYLEDNAVEIY